MKRVATCEHCAEPLGSVLVTTLDGSKLHPDCYDKWRRDMAAEAAAQLGPWSQKRGQA